MAQRLELTNEDGTNPSSVCVVSACAVALPPRPNGREAVLGVNVTRVSGGRVREQLGYTKTPGVLPLPE
jgi:hypothetical protein